MILFDLFLFQVLCWALGLQARWMVPAFREHTVKWGGGGTLHATRVSVNAGRDYKMVLQGDIGKTNWRIQEDLVRR